MFLKSSRQHVTGLVRHVCKRKLQCRLLCVNNLSTLQLDVMNHNELKKLKVPEPSIDLNYYCDFNKRDELKNNVVKRKSDVDIDTVLELNRSLNALVPNCDEYRNIKEKLSVELTKLPNRSHPLIIELDEPRVIRTVGRKKQFEFKPKEFPEIASHLRGARTDKSNFTGHRSYFFFGQLADLETALINYSLKKLLSKGFQLVSVPDILDRRIIESCGMNTRGKRNQVYSLNSELYGSDLCLSGTSEMALAGFLMNQTLRPAELPLRLAAVSRCYRAETSRTSNERGIFRVHQFTKVEMFGVTEPDGSEDLLEEFRAIQEESFEELGLHFQVLDMPPCELGAQAYRKYDVEAWMPGRGLYGEVSSCSSCTDYQSRRLGIRISNSQQFAHTVNGTALAVPRTILALVENFQNKDITIDIPPVLQPFMGSANLITRNTLFPKISPYRSKGKSDTNSN
ncbi:hypothetical protein LSTR_LSTR001215 [Laodelphax striatellus]|uniref:serine--tRNA ligase n=1 Tax=Laodelphax striatellus TaxID=195883 RepID=A0A482XBH2_LAOST|nr:hypothetical protein LSTR_LSTR001215 [Laodelphax striatellus]